jgi:hypothetical protein
MKKILFIIFSIFFLGQTVGAADFALQGYAEIGKRSTADVYQEEDYDDDYHYENYHVTFNHKVSNKFHYDIRSFFYDKNYSQQSELDNFSTIFKSRSAYKMSKRVNFALTLKYKEKRFRSRSTNDFNQLGVLPQFSYKKQRSYVFYLLTGVDRYDYLHKANKDQLKIFANVKGKKYFSGNRLIFDGSYKIETLNKQKINRKRTKHYLNGGCSYRFNMNWIDKVAYKMNWGYSDTKDDDEKDIDYDYKYLSHYIKTEHLINRDIKTDIKYSYFNKDYLNVALDHHGFYIDNSWNYSIFDNKSKIIWFDLNLSFKNVDYSQDSERSYHSECLKLRINTRKKEQWKLSLAVQSYFYQYGNSDNDKNRYYSIFSVEKSLFNDVFKIIIDMKYKFVDYKSKNNKDNMAIRLGFQYEF